MAGLSEFFAVLVKKAYLFFLITFYQKPVTFRILYHHTVHQKQGTHGTENNSRFLERRVRKIHPAACYSVCLKNASKI